MQFKKSQLKSALGNQGKFNLKLTKYRNQRRSEREKEKSKQTQEREELKQQSMCIASTTTTKTTTTTTTITKTAEHFWFLPFLIFARMHKKQ